MSYRTIHRGCVLLTLLVSATHADDRLAGIACRSVHLAYDVKGHDAIAFYNELTPEHSAPGTYYCAIGFNRGYFGLQELADGRKLVIFSVWDPGAQDNPTQVDESRRVRLIQKADNVRVGRFGGEGTGGQSFLDHDWSTGRTYRFLVKARVVDDERTEFAAYFQAPDDAEWTHMVTFSTLAEGQALGGFYAFIEDFRRNRVSATQARDARFGHASVCDPVGLWHPIPAARFTADSNPATNIDAGTRDGLFFLATGGATQNDHAKLRERIILDPPPPDTTPENLP